MKKRKKNRRVLFKNILLGTVALGAAVGFIAVGVFLVWASTLTMPTIDIIEKQRAGQSTKIYDKTGEVLLYDMHQDVRRTVVSLDEMSDHIKNATIAIEDSGFYSHFGIEPLAIVRVVIRNLREGDLLGGHGGSTITQQVVKNTLLVKDKKISRKLKEWVLAIKLERDLTKDEILELYLNEVPYGGTKYGIEEASQGFFGKSAKDLSITESAYLASLPQLPTYYSPYGNNREALETRKNMVLDRMHEFGHISEEELEAAKNEEVEFRPFSSGSIKAPHFVFYVIDQLAELYEYEDVATANLRVITTLDWELQKEAERIVYERAMENSEKFNASNASLMAVDPKTGGILVMVGSRDYFDEEIDGNFNIGLAKRQPGSSFKPFAYASALRKGYTTETVVYDSRTQFSTNCKKTDLSGEGECYSPGNYDSKYRGPMTFRDALAQSVNIPAVKVLYLAGMDDTMELVQDMGVSTLEDWQRYGLTLVLGGGEVSLLEMTSAYGVFANEGVRYPHTCILEIDSINKTNIYKHELEEGDEVLEVDIARSVSDMLADNHARTPAFGSNSFLHFPGRDVAVKTGTTNDYRDAWIIGYTPEIAVGAWAGNNSNMPMEKKVAGFIIAPMWNEFMNAYFEKYPDSTDFTPPLEIDNDIKPVLHGNTLTVEEEFGTSSDNKISKRAHSILHYVNKEDPRGPIPINPALDAQYDYWEYGVLLWSVTKGEYSIFDVLEDGDEENNDENKPKVRIREPDDGDSVKRTSVVEVEYSVRSEEDVVRVEYYINGNKIGTDEEDSGSFFFMPGERGLEKGTHTLLVVAYTESGSRGGSSVDFRVR